MARNDKPNVDGTGPELVPVAETDALSLALLRPDGIAGTGELALGDLLSDAMFGEVIDISDLIPQVLSPKAGVSQLPPAEAAEGQATGSDIATASDQAAALTILYDDSLLAAGDTIF